LKQGRLGERPDDGKTDACLAIRLLRQHLFRLAELRLGSCLEAQPATEARVGDLMEA